MFSNLFPSGLLHSESVPCPLRSGEVVRFSRCLARNVDWSTVILAGEGHSARFPTLRGAKTWYRPRLHLMVVQSFLHGSTLSHKFDGTLFFRTSAVGARLKTPTPHSNRSSLDDSLPLRDMVAFKFPTALRYFRSSRIIECILAKDTSFHEQFGASRHRNSCTSLRNATPLVPPSGSWTTEDISSFLSTTPTTKR